MPEYHYYHTYVTYKFGSNNHLVKRVTVTIKFYDTRKSIRYQKCRKRKFSEQNLQETENGATFAKGPAKTEEEMKLRKEGDRKYVNPMSDYGFKAVFGLENVMKTFLNDLLLPKTPIVQITFLDKEMLPQNDEERGVVYDLRCKTEDGTEFIVEMQNRSQAYFSDRIVFYLSYSIAPQG